MSVGIPKIHGIKNLFWCKNYLKFLIVFHNLHFYTFFLKIPHSSTVCVKNALELLTFIHGFIHRCTFNRNPLPSPRRKTFLYKFQMPNFSYPIKLQPLLIGNRKCRNRNRFAMAFGFWRQSCYQHTFSAHTWCKGTPGTMSIQWTQWWKLTSESNPKGPKWFPGVNLNRLNQSIFHNSDFNCKVGQKLTLTLATFATISQPSTHAAF